MTRSGYRKGDRVIHRFQGLSTVVTGSMDRKGYIRIAPDHSMTESYEADPVLLTPASGSPSPGFLRA